MKLTVATNWDNSLIEQIGLMNNNSKNVVMEVFGSEKTNFLGSARPADALPEVSWSQMKNHIDLCHKHNLKFNYVINAPSYHLKEFEIVFRQQLVKFVSELISLGVDLVTVANPILIETIRKNFPNLPICASTVCKIDTLRRIDWYTELKINRIILETDINRDFKLLKKIRSRTKVELEILGNLQCILQCPNNTYDYVCDGFRSQSSCNRDVFYNYPKIKCSNVKLKNPVEFIRSPWIRPEDTKFYEDAGIDFLKVAGREAPTKWLVNTINAYADSSYIGNMFDLVGNQVISSVGSLPLDNEQKLKPLLIYLDNKKLDGFLDYFVKGKCTFDCDSCKYCHRLVKEIVITDQERKDYIQRSDLLLEKIRKNEI